MARSDYASCYYIGCPNKVKLFKRIRTNKTYETMIKLPCYEEILLSGVCLLYPRVKGNAR
jgi:hypothetical protein